MTNNAAERALRGVALGRKSWLFAGSERGGQRAAAMYTLIVTAKMNDIDPQAWLADLLARLPDMPASRVHELLPAYSDEAGHAFQLDAGHLFRFHSGRHSDLKPATCWV